MYVIKEEPLRVGSEVVVKCDLGQWGEVLAGGRVIYTKKLFGDFMTLPPGMAIKFHGLTEEEAAALKFFIEDLMAREIFDGGNNGFFER